MYRVYQFFAATLVGVAFMFGNCQPTKNSKPTLESSLAYTSGPAGREIPHWYAESTSAVIPPQGAPRGDSDCPKGRMLISTGSGAAGDPGTPAIIPRDLGDTTTADPSPIPHSSLGGLSANDYLPVSGDNILTRRKNGDLVLVWAGITWDPFPNDTPVWSGYDHVYGHKGVRGALFSWVSSDCGTSWQPLTTIDSGDSKLLNGDCGWPREGWHGGFDREEVYADPFTGNLYLTAGSVSGGHPSFKAPGRSHMLLFVLRPGATSWELLVSFDGTNPQNQTNFESVGAPVAMTTTEQGRLYLAQCVGDKPTLYWMDKEAIASGQKTLSGKADIFFGPEKPENQKPENKCATLPAGSIAGNFASYYASWPIISRWYAGPSSGVRIAYPAVEGGQQVARIIAVNDTSGPKIDVTPLTTLNAGNLSLLQAAFIENDPTEAKGKTDVTAMYWLAADQKAMWASYTIFRGPIFQDVKYLSAADGNPRSWVPQLYAQWGGDYLRGAFFFDGKDLNYFMQWPESDNSTTKPNLNLHYRIIKVNP